MWIECTQIADAAAAADNDDNNDISFDSIILGQRLNKTTVDDERRWGWDDRGRVLCQHPVELIGRSSQQLWCLYFAA